MSLNIAPPRRVLERYHRPLLLDFSVLDLMTLRTDDGHRLTVQWGEPDEQGFYTPTLTTSDDGMVVVQRVVLAELERRAGGEES